MQKELQSARFCFTENPEGTSYETKGTACRRCALGARMCQGTFFLFNEIPNPIFLQEIITEYLHKIRNLYTIFILKILSLIKKQERKNSERKERVCSRLRVLFYLQGS